MVLGGDYQGLGIVRNLAQHGVRTFVIDDERSIARFSRHVHGSARIVDLGTGDSFVDELSRLGARHGLDGWVVYPTRDETVAAIARNRERLAAQFRIATAAWDAVRWAWDKRNTYRLAAELDVPAPRTWRPADRTELEAIDGQPPFAIKPAIKENFFYETKAKAWRADSAAELATLFTRAAAIVGPGEVMVQELIPGAAHSSTATAPCARRAARSPRWSFAACASIRRTSGAQAPSWRRSRSRPSRSCPSASSAESATTAWSSSSTSWIRGTGSSSSSTSTRVRAAITRSARAAGVDFPYLLFRQQLGLPVEAQRARAGVRWVRLLTDVPRLWARSRPAG